MSAEVSAPFPSQPTTVSYGSPVRLIPERSEFVPPWCPWATGEFSEPEKVIVKQGGQRVEPGFTVAEILPERRWAVGRDGEIITGLEFIDRYQRKLREFFLYASTEARQGRPKVPSTWNVSREPVPSPVQYVSERLDPRDARKTLPIGFDPEATKGAKPNRLWDSKNERFLEGRERLNALLVAYREEESGGRVTLLPHERQEVERHLAGKGGTTATGETETTLKIKMLAEMREEGQITSVVYEERVAALLGIESAAAKSKARPRSAFTQMSCGEDVSNFKRKEHMKECGCHPVKEEK